MTKNNYTMFVPTEGPYRDHEIEVHVNLMTYIGLSNNDEYLGYYELDHPTETASWVPSKFYEEARHG